MRVALLIHILFFNTPSIMRTVSLLIIFFVAVTYCYSASDTDEKVDYICFGQTYARPCVSKCPNKTDIEESKRTGKLHCCLTSGCSFCMTNIGAGRCGIGVDKLVKTITDIYDMTFRYSGCSDSEKYPSPVCDKYFHSRQPISGEAEKDSTTETFYSRYNAWFYVVPLPIVAVIGGAVAFVVIRRR